MKIILNHELVINKVIKADEVIERNAPTRLVFFIDYSQNTFESLQTFFNTETLTDIQIIQDDEVLSLYTKYNEMFSLIHHQADQKDFIELIIREGE